MLIEIVPLLVLAFASYRITRFLVIDDLIDGIRSKVHSFFINRSNKNGPFHLGWQKLYQLSSCTWCLGFWVSLALYTAYVWNEPWEFNQYDVFNVFAIAGIQGILHALEPDESG